MANINIPTILIASFPVLCQNFERYLANQPLLDNCTIKRNTQNEHIYIFRGSSWLALPEEELEDLRKLPAQQRGHLFRLLPKVLMSCFELARQDFLYHKDKPLWNKTFNEGCFALVRFEDKKPNHLRRLCKHNHMNPDTQQVHIFKPITKLLMKMSMGCKIGNKKYEFKQLIIPNKKIELCSSQIDSKQHKGGVWGLAQINPELFSLAFSNFCQIPEQAFKLPPKEFTVYCSFKAQSAFQRTDQVTVYKARLLKESCLIETSTRGDARALKNLWSILVKLKEKLFIDFDWAGDWFFQKPLKLSLKIQPNTSLQNDISTKYLAAKHYPEPNTSLQEDLKNKVNQILKDCFDDLVITFVKGNSKTIRLLLTHGDGSFSTYDEHGYSLQTIT